MSSFVPEIKLGDEWQDASALRFPSQSQAVVYVEDFRRRHSHAAINGTRVKPSTDRPTHKIEDGKLVYIGG